MKEWTGQSFSSLQRIADDICRWATITAEESVIVPQRRLGVTGVSSLLYTSLLALMGKLGGSKVARIESPL